jgi:hypothetical protein
MSEWRVIRPVFGFGPDHVQYPPLLLRSGIELTSRRDNGEDGTLLSRDHNRSASRTRMQERRLTTIRRILSAKGLRTFWRANVRKRPAQDSQVGLHATPRQLGQIFGS